MEEAEKFKTELKNIYSQFIPQERDYLKNESDKIIAEKNKIGEDIKTAEKSRVVFSGDSPADSAREIIKEIEVRLAKEDSDLGKLRSSRNSLERELGKLEGVIEYLPRRQAGRQSLAVKFSESEENLPLVSHQEVLEIMKTVQDSAVLGAVNSDIAEARKIFEKIASSAREFIAKISEKSGNADEGENDMGDLNKKRTKFKR